MLRSPSTSALLLHRELLANVEICKDGHKCENGSKCVEDTNNENSYHCDCDENTAGLYCSHEATEFCSLGERHFCTNLGTCQAKVTDDDPHPGCICREGYEGTFCQFVKNTVPEEWARNKQDVLSMSQTTTKAGENNIDGSSASSVVTPFGFFLLIAFFSMFVVSIAVLSRKIMKMSDNKANDPEFIMEIEDDDEVLFDDIDDYNYGLETNNPDSMHGGGGEKKTGNPKQIT